MMTTTDKPASWPRVAVGRRYEMRSTGEVRIYEGFGRVSKVDLETGRRNGKVVINADHLMHPVQGWCETTSPIWDVVTRAHESGARVAYQVVLERRRPKPGDDPIDPNIPIEDLDAQTQTTSKVTFLYPVNGAGDPVEAVPAGWVPEAAGAAVERVAGPEPEAAPPAGPEPEAAPAPVATDSSYYPQDPGGAPSCPLCGKTTIAAGELRRHPPTNRFAHRRPCLEEWLSRPAAAPANDDAPAADPPPPAAAPAPKGGARLEEPKPWQRTDSRGQLNVGSFAIQAAEDMTVLAFRLLLAHRVAAGDEPAAPPEPAIKALAHRLLSAADRCQQSIRPDGHLDRNDNSHRRARDAVRAALEAYPVPWDGEPEQLRAIRDQWVCHLAECATILVRVSIELDR